jgi:hypothetical protein
MPLDRRSLARRVLLGPSILRRAAAGQAEDRAQAWMLRQPKYVRASFVREVLDKGDSPNAEQIWMLRQRREVRESYIREVLRGD